MKYIWRKLHYNCFFFGTFFSKVRLDTQRKPCSKGVPVASCLQWFMHSTFYMEPFICITRVIFNYSFQTPSKLIPKGAEGNLWKRTRADVKNQARTELYAALPNVDESRQSILWLIPQVNNSLPLPCPKWGVKKWKKPSLCCLPLSLVQWKVKLPAVEINGVCLHSNSMLILNPYLILHFFIAPQMW